MTVSSPFPCWHIIVSGCDSAWLGGISPQLLFGTSALAPSTGPGVLSPDGPSFGQIPVSDPIRWRLGRQAWCVYVRLWLPGGGSDHRKVRALVPPSNLELDGFPTLFPPPGPTWTNRDTGSCGTPRFPGRCPWFCDHLLGPRWEGTMSYTWTRPRLDSIPNLLLHADTQDELIPESDQSEP